MDESLKQSFKLGVVEGFFGKPWPWDARTAYADFLSEYGFNTYLYAPKDDRLLRQNWHIPFPDEHLEKLKALAGVHRDNNIYFSIGLSPFELYRNFNTENQGLLKAKLEQINEINPSILCILFDDMQGDFDSLAEQQLKITNFIIENSQASHFIFCPTYYSDDPGLIDHFGKKPPAYLEDIGKLLDPAVDIFWTGPSVFSKHYPAKHLQEIAAKLQRKPLIWDNYPVNDAKRLTGFLHLEPFPDQSKIMREFSAGHLANPMNQAYLSRLALYSLSQHYQGKAASNLLQTACNSLCPRPLAELILADADYFQEQGLSAMTTEDKQAYLDRYLPYNDDPMVKEIIAWLNGVYVFDPNCLT
jgi:hyaluronoglucosaminidase